MSAIKLSDADRRAIEDQIEKYREAVLAADWAAWGATLSPDVFLSAAFESPRTGRQAAVDWVSAFPSVTAFTIRIDELDGEGGLAFARGRYELEFRMPDGSQSTDDGCWLQTHRRMSDGSWPYTNVMFHSTRAPAP